MCMTFKTMLVSFNRRERHRRKPNRLAKTGLGVDRRKKIVVNKISSIEVKKLWSFIFLVSATMEFSFRLMKYRKSESRFSR